MDHCSPGSDSYRIFAIKHRTILICYRTLSTSNGCWSKPYLTLSTTGCIGFHTFWYTLIIKRLSRRNSISYWWRKVECNVEHWYIDCMQINATQPTLPNEAKCWTADRVLVVGSSCQPSRSEAYLKNIKLWIDLKTFEARTTAKREIYETLHLW